MLCASWCLHLRADCEQTHPEAAVWDQALVSTLLASGVLDDQSLNTLLHGVRSTSSSTRKGHSCNIVGDFNIRVGNMHLDVPSLEDAALPPSTYDHAHNFIHICAGIPARRHNIDCHVPDREGAMHLLHRLNGVGCVLLNGRVARDPHNQYTFVSERADGQPP